MNILKIHDAGTQDYHSAWRLQKKLQSELINSREAEHLVFCEHPAVITYGNSAELEKVLLSSPVDLCADKIELIKTDRGGNITYHGPGQLLCYLIIDISKRRPDVSWYLRTLENCVLALLSEYNISAQTMPGQTGVWIKNSKICSIGVRFSRWCSMHGLALNISSESESGFSHIIPCGIEGARATSIQSVIGHIPQKNMLIESLSGHLISRFYKDFDLDLSISRTAVVSI